MRRPLVIHPFLLALFPILFLFAHNIETMSSSQIVLPSAIMSAFTFLAVLLLRMIFSDGRRAGMIVSIFLILFLSYSPFFVLIHFLLADRLGDNIGSTCLLVGWAILLLLGVYAAIKTADPGNWTRVLNLVAITLVVIPLLKVGVYELRAKRLKRSFTAAAAEHTNTGPNDERKEDLPDIYYIILDRYASSSTLQEHFRFDNSEFTGYLTSKGFYVASEARANYPKTFQSLASSLNMKHLTYLTDELGRDASDQAIVYAMLQDYAAWRFLRSRGYTFIHVGSRWEPTRRNRYADVNFSMSLTDFPMMLYRSTMLNPIGGKLGILDHRQMQQRAILRVFDRLAEVPHIEGPKFVFAHILLPHGPYMFGPQGEMLTEEQVEARTETENYLNQLAFANGKVKRLTDQILSQSDRPPVIVLQADEGPCECLEEFGESCGDTIDWRQLSDGALRAHMRIFSAYYLPGADYEDILYPSVTPVNSFRIVFDHYFGSGYGLVDDRSYVFEDLEHPYSFIDVTDTVSYDS